MTSHPELDLNLDAAIDEEEIGEEVAEIDAEEAPQLDADFEQMDEAVEADAEAVETDAEAVEPEEPHEPEEPEEDKPKKPGQWNIFMVLLAISLLAICLSCLTLFLYLNKQFGSAPWWSTNDAFPSEGESYNHQFDKISLNRHLA